MQFSKPFLNFVIAFFVLAFLSAQATAASSELFVAVAPVQVTNHLKTDAGRQIVLPFLQVNSKQAGRTVCRWMPRVRDALHSALNSRSAQPTTGKTIGRILTEAVQRVVPKGLVINVVTFNARGFKSTQAEKNIKEKLLCNKPKKQARRKKTPKSVQRTTWTH